MLKPRPALWMMSHGPAVVRAALALSIAASGVGAQEPTNPVATQTWKARIGDDPTWANPRFDDSEWTDVAISDSWAEQGFEGVDSIIWYRGTVRLAGPRTGLALLIGEARFGSYTVFIAGEEVGRYGFASGEIPVPASQWFPVASTAIDPAGTLPVAIRFHRSGLSDRALGTAGPAGDGVVVGDVRTLSERAALERSQGLVAAVPDLLFTVVFWLIAVMGLLVYVQQRGQRVYLWFVVLCLAYGFNTIAVSDWAFAFTDRLGLVNRLIDVSGHLSAAVVIQFLWTFLNRKIGPVLRSYQLLHLAAALVLLVVPLSLVIATRAARWWLLVPLLAASAVVCVQAVRGGDREARPIVVGGLVLIGVELTHLVPTLGISVMPIPASWGFLALIVSMGVSLAARIRRTVTELDALRVAERQLAGALEESRRMDALGRLAGSIAHDFNNLLASIVGYADLLLRETPEDGKERRYVMQVTTAARRAGELVKQILIFGRRVEGDRTTVRIQDLIHETVELLRPSLPEHLTVDVDVESDCPPVHGDATQLSQVLMNLATNGGHAMRDGGGVLTIRLASVEVTPTMAQRRPGLQAGRHAQITVRDTGPGISDEVKERIFEPFFTTKDATRGTGLGLAVAHGIVHTHGGAIWVESHAGDGTAFQVQLPLLAADAVPSRQPDTSATPGGTETVLLVDDEQAVADVSAELLKELGYEVTVATDPEKALEIFRTRPDHFDIVITDQVMPRLSGDELARRVMDVRPGTPVILHTGFADRLNTREIEQIGIRAVLSKPDSIRTIGSVVRRVLDEHRRA